jgi:hypothetical protein
MVQEVKYAVKRTDMARSFFFLFFFFFFFHAPRARKVYKSRLDEKGEWKTR